MRKHYSPELEGIEDVQTREKFGNYEATLILEEPIDPDYFQIAMEDAGYETVRKEDSSQVEVYEETEEGLESYGLIEETDEIPITSLNRYGEPKSRSADKTLETIITYLDFLEYDTPRQKTPLE